MPPGIVKNLIAGNFEQRSNQQETLIQSTHRSHSGQPAKARSALESVEEGLGLIVGVVGGGDPGTSGFHSHLHQGIESKHAGGGFHGLLLRSALRGDIDGTNQHGESPLCRQLTDKLFIGIRLGSPQTMIHMADGQPPADRDLRMDPMDHGRHDNRIGAAGDGQQNSILRGHKSPRLNRLSNGLFQILHHTTMKKGSAPNQERIPERALIQPARLVRRRRRCGSGAGGVGQFIDPLFDLFPFLFREGLFFQGQLV